MEQKIFFKNSAGNKLCGILSNPTGDNTKPIILMVHGFSSSKNSNKFTTLQKVFNNKNISTFRIDFYAHGESEGDFSQITITKAINDILSAIIFLKEIGYKKIGLVGSSFGGIASLISATKTDVLFALALICPVSDYSESYQRLLGESGIENWKKLGYRLYEKSNKEKVKVNYSLYEDFKNNCAYDYAQKIQIPTIIVHGSKDEFAPVSQSIKTAELIPNCTLKVIEGSDHDFTEPELFQEMIKEISSFVAEQQK